MDIPVYEQDAENNILKKSPKCPKCKAELGYRVRRGFLFRSILIWLHVKRYYCYKCKRKQYVWN